MKRLWLKAPAAYLMTILSLSVIVSLESCSSSSETEDNYKVMEITQTLSDAIKNFDCASEFHSGIAMVERNSRMALSTLMANAVI